ncbi:hypothetical protein TcasGA2_TC032004 [Tribolium castaneum]|uniref:Uncharacterized protein n=1 Tax=Tribolium castaneum TaxID=7070 RepID=A0A139WNB1_TRICA|nr:hypothetical protein TcasGA2_TC032004 [Tribolium castaneum]
MMFPNRKEDLFSRKVKLTPPAYRRIKIASVNLNLSLPITYPFQRSKTPAWTYNNNYIFYIDASKSDTVDAAYVTNDTQQAFRLSPECSVNTAELYAILRALQSAEAHHESNKSLAICTDSISSILNIQKLYPTNPIMIKIQEEIQKHTNCRKGSTSHLGTSTLRNRRKRTRRSNS